MLTSRMKRVSPACCAISAGLGGGQSQFLNRYDGAAASLSFLRLRERGMMDEQALLYAKVCLISFSVAYLAVLTTSDAGSVAILAFFC